MNCILLCIFIVCVLYILITESTNWRKFIDICITNFLIYIWRTFKFEVYQVIIIMFLKYSNATQTHVLFE